MSEQPPFTPEQEARVREMIATAFADRARAASEEVEAFVASYCGMTVEALRERTARNLAEHPTNPFPARGTP